MSEPKQSALAVMASRYSVEPTKLLDTLKGTVFQGASNEELLALVVVANQYGLNPFTREIYAFPKKGGGIQPVVSIDGWIRMMNEHPAFDGIDFEFCDKDGDLSCTASISRKDRSRPISVTEYLSECERGTEPWKTCKRRMLRHRALIQCARVAFGFGGFADPEDQSVIEVAPMRNVTPAPVALPPPKADEVPESTPQERLADIITKEGFTFDNFVAWGKVSGNVPNPDSIPSFADIPTDVAIRLLRATKGLIQQLKAAKGGA